MCLPSPPKIDQATKDAQAAKAAEEAQRRAELKQQQLEKSKRILSGGGSRSLITSGSGSGYGRNFLK